jgi:hypothetical protein
MQQIRHNADYLSVAFLFVVNSINTKYFIKFSSQGYQR